MTQASGRVTWPKVCLSFLTARQPSVSTSHSREGQGLLCGKGWEGNLAHGCHLLWTILAICVCTCMYKTPPVWSYTPSWSFMAKEFHILKSKSWEKEPLPWNSAELPHSLFYSVTQRHNKQITSLCQGQNAREKDTGKTKGDMAPPFCQHLRHGTQITLKQFTLDYKYYKILYFLSSHWIFCFVFSLNSPM